MSAKRNLLSGTIALGLACFSGCSFSYDKTAGGRMDVPSYRSGQVSFALVDQYVFQPKCTGCHNATRSGGNVRLDGFANVSANLADIRNDVLVKGSMPKAPVSALSDAQRNLLQSWLDAGAPEKVAGGDVVTLPLDQPLRPVFSSIRQKVFEPKCLVCHSPGSDSPKAAKIPVDTLEALTASPESGDEDDTLVVPGKPDKSYLLVLINPDTRKRMPPRKSAVAPVTPEELSVIRTWIAEGAQP